MSPRTGRPTDDPKDVQMRIRISKADKEKLRYCAERLGVTEAEVMRRGIDKLYKELKEIIL